MCSEQMFTLFPSPLDVSLSAKRLQHRIKPASANAKCKRSRCPNCQQHRVSNATSCGVPAPESARRVRESARRAGLASLYACCCCMLLLYATQDSKREDSSEQNEEPAERWLCMRWDAHADARELPENLGSTATGAHHALAGGVIACMHPGIHGTGICFRYMFIFTL